MGELSPWHWLIVLAAFILLFGSSKLPEMARSVGQSMRILKAEVRAQHNDRQSAGASDTVTECAPPVPTPPVTAPPQAPPPADPQAG